MNPRLLCAGLAAPVPDPAHLARAGREIDRPLLAAYGPRPERSVCSVARTAVAAVRELGGRAPIAAGPIRGRALPQRTAFTAISALGPADRA